MEITETQSAIISALKTRDLAKAEVSMLELPQAECSVIHHFGPGLYIRELHMPAGIFAIGHHQKYAHLNVFLKGRVLILKDDGGTEEMEAPMMFVGKPGRKAGYVLEEVVWQNIYATDETDIEKLEQMLLQKSDGFNGCHDASWGSLVCARDDDRIDYGIMLDQAGFSRETARSQSENESDQCHFPFGAWKVKTGKSAIEGTGMFATAPIGAGEMIAPARIGGNRTPAGRFTNHAKNPNARMVMLPGGDIDLFALRDIEGCHGGQDGEEITIDYREALSLSGIKAKEEACQA